MRFTHISLFFTLNIYSKLKDDFLDDLISIITRNKENFKEEIMIY